MTNVNAALVYEKQMDTNCSICHSCYNENRSWAEHTRIQAITIVTVKVLGSVRNGNKVSNKFGESRRSDGRPRPIDERKQIDIPLWCRDIGKVNNNGRL